MMMDLSIYGVAVISGSLYSRFYGMSIRAHHHLSGDCLDLRSANNGYPFCHKTFLKLRCHLPWCKERKGQDYSYYLSPTTLAKRNKAGKKMCPSVEGDSSGWIHTLRVVNTYTNAPCGTLVFFHTGWHDF